MSTQEAPLHELGTEGRGEWADALPLILVLLGIFVSPLLYDLLRLLPPLVGRQ